MRHPLTIQHPSDMRTPKRKKAKIQPVKLWAWVGNDGFIEIGTLSYLKSASENYATKLIGKGPGSARRVLVTAVKGRKGK